MDEPTPVESYIESLEKKIAELKNQLADDKSNSATSAGYNSAAADIERLREILEWYADDTNYYTETKTPQFIINGRTEEKFYCTETNSKSAKEGLEIIKKIKAAASL